MVETSASHQNMKKVETLGGGVTRARRVVTTWVLACLLGYGISPYARSAVPTVVRQPTQAVGQGPSREPTQGAESAGERADRLHDSLYSKVESVFVSLDRRFVEPGETPEAVPASPFRIGLGARLLDRNSGAFDLNSDFDADLRLPNLERRLRIILTTEGIAETPGVEPGNPLRAALRLDAFRNVSVDVGVKLNAPPVAFAALRWSRMYEAGGWDFYPFAKLFAETDDGVGAATGVTLDRWAGRTLFRSATSLRWRKDRDATDWSQVLTGAYVDTLIQPDRYSTRIRGKDLARAWGAQVEAGGEETSRVDFYEAGVFLKRPLWSDWAYFGLMPFVLWERERGWDAELGVRFAFDLLFWGPTNRN